MSRVLPLMRCWRIEADALPDDMHGAEGGGFTLPGAAALSGFADLIGSEAEHPPVDSAASAPFPLPAMIPDNLCGSAVLRCEVDFGALRGDHAVMTIDHITGRGCVMLGDTPLAAFDSAAASYRSINEAFELAAAPCALAVDLTDALRRGRRETLSICFDDARPAGVSGPVMLRAARFGRLCRLSISPDAANQTMTLCARIVAAHTGRFILRAQPVRPDGTGEAARETGFRLACGEAFDAQMTLLVPGGRFVPGISYDAAALKITLLYQKEDGAHALPCDAVTLLCGYPGKAPEAALPLTPAECMLDPDMLTGRLRDLRIPAVRLPIPAPDALYRALTRAGIAARMPDNLPLRARLERLPCASFAPERVGEYAAVSPAASAWQMGSMAHAPRPVDPSLSDGELLAEIAGRQIDPQSETVCGVLAWLRAVAVRMRAEAARQNRFSGALCAPGEWNTPDIADSLRTAYAPLHLSALPLLGAWWSASRFSAAIHAFIPEGAYTSDDPLIVLAILEDEDGNELARLRAPCRHSGGHIGVLQAQLPDHACVLQLVTRLTLHEEILEESAMPVYVGERGPLEAAFG